MFVDKTGLPWLKGRTLHILLTSVTSSGFLLFGYDQGAMSGVIISKYWLHQMGNPSQLIVGTITAMYDVGAVFGALLAAATAERIGRKRGLMVGTGLVVIGSVLMGAAMEQVMMYFGRIITGLGIGYITSVAPVYQSEVAIPKRRGWLLALHTSDMLLGLLVAYWMNYGFYFYDSPIQWRFPLLFQIIPALYILAVTPWLPETPRWLMFHEGADSGRGLEVLSKLRDKPKDHPEVQREKEEIQYAIRVESEEEGSWADLFRDGGCQANKRFFLALGIQFMQQMTGINIITYYSPTLLQKFLNMSQERALFVGGFLQIWYIFASLVTWWLIDFVGRRRLFIFFAFAMALVFIGEAICVAVGGYGAGIAAVFFVFLFEGCFTWGWMSTVWVYPSEILPLKLRAKGNALAAGADYLGNFLVVEITPPAFDNIGYKIYIVFAILNLANAVICWLFYPETSGLTLESVDSLFLPQPEDEEIIANQVWYRKFQWSVIGKSKHAVAKAKELRRLDKETGNSDMDAKIVREESERRTPSEDGKGHSESADTSS